MYPVIWSVRLEDSKHIFEYDENKKETLFPDILDRKSEFTHLGLIDTTNNLQYAIDLKTGEFMFNGFPISLGKEIDGRTFNFTHKDLPYKNGVIQYKCSKPLNLGGGGVPYVEVATYNVGYKVDIPKGMIVDETKYNRIEVIHVQPMLSINADTLKSTISISSTIEITDLKNNKKKTIRV